MDGPCSEAQRLAGINRRRFLQVGSLGALGLTLPDLFGLQAAHAARGDEHACIILWLSGGPSQFDTFDPLLVAFVVVCGGFAPIATNVSGIRISEALPRLAKQADRYALLRSVYHTLDDQGRGIQTAF